MKPRLIIGVLLFLPLYLYSQILSAANAAIRPFDLCEKPLLPANESQFFFPFELPKIPSGPLLFTFNSGNSGKLADYQKLFSHHHIPIHRTYDIDQKEIDADDLSVIIHKASSFPLRQGVIIVDDSSLHVDGGDFGIHVKWRLDQLRHYIGHKASFSSLLALRFADQIYVFHGAVHGKIVAPRGISQPGLNFDPYFEVDAVNKTLAEGVPWEITPRFQAVQALARWQPISCAKVMTHWKGSWQK